MKLLAHAASLALSLWLLLSGAAYAHKPSDSYLTIHEDAGKIRWDIALRDLDFAIGLDQNGDSTITWGEVKARQAAIVDYAIARLKVTADEAACPARFDELLIDRHSDGAYAVLRLTAPCLSGAGAIGLDYSLFFDIDAQHRAVVSLPQNGRTHLAVLSIDARRHQFDVGDAHPFAFLEFVGEGIAHVFGGLDHMLFMAVLLLPIMRRRTAVGWVPQDNAREAAADVFMLVTMFTLAHATTLTLALLGFITIPSWIVETAIALSIAAAAADNVWPIFGRRRWLLAFGFGLVHGAGFAGVLEALDLSPWPLAQALAGLNIGVEIAQLLVAAIVVPVTLALWRLNNLRDWIVPIGSAGAAIVALTWAAERALGITLVG